MITEDTTGVEQHRTRLESNRHSTKIIVQRLNNKKFELKQVNLFELELLLVQNSVRRSRFVQKLFVLEHSLEIQAKGREVIP